MFKNAFSKFFPTPVFLSMPSFGVDISDESLKFIELIPGNKGLRVGKHGERPVPKGVIESGKIIAPKRLEEILVALAKEEDIHSVRVSLPEEQVYLFSLKLDKLGLVKIREGIELALEEHIPIPAQEAIFDYNIINEDAKSFYLQVAAIQKNVIEGYLAVFANAGIYVNAFELEADAIARAVIKKGDLGTYMIVDFGQMRTGIFIVSRGLVMFTSTLEVGGIMLTNMIKKSFNVTDAEAEEMKKKYGLERNRENKEIFAVLLNSVSILRDEIVKHFLYWHTHQDEQGNNNPPIKNIILCGGDSNLIGLPDYFSVSMKTDVNMADVWVNIRGENKEVPSIGFKQALSFASAIGLALSNFDYD